MESLGGVYLTGEVFFYYTSDRPAPAISPSRRPDVRLRLAPAPRGAQRSARGAADRRRALRSACRGHSAGGASDRLVLDPDAGDARCRGRGDLGTSGGGSHRAWRGGSPSDGNPRAARADYPRDLRRAGALASAPRGTDG